MPRTPSIALPVLGLLSVFAGCGSSSGPEAVLQVMPTAAQQNLSYTPWPSDSLLENGHVMLAALPTSPTDSTQPVLDDLHTLEDGFDHRGRVLPGVGGD